VAVHSSPENIFLGVRLVIYNFICLIVTVSDESNTDEAAMTKKVVRILGNVKLTSSNQKSCVRP